MARAKEANGGELGMLGVSSKNDEGVNWVDKGDPDDAMPLDSDDDAPRGAWDSNPQRRKSRHYAVNSEELGADIVAMGEDKIEIDPLFYDISDEADEEVAFRLGSYLEDLVILLFHPLSMIYVYCAYGGYEGLQLMSLAPPTPEPKVKGTIAHGKFYDEEAPLFQPNAGFFFMGGLINALIRNSWLLIFALYYRDAASANWEGMSFAPVYAFVLSVILTAISVFTICTKKAFRKRSAMERMHLHKERRNEELFFGWLPLPWTVALYELRLAAHQVGSLAIEAEYITFADTSVEELKRSIGDNILGVIDRNGLQAVKPIEEREVNEQGEETLVTRPGSKCSMLAFLMRATLDKSFGSPPFGEPGKGLYIESHSSNAFVAYLMLLITMPYMVDFAVRGGGKYSSLGIVTCVLSVLMSLMQGVMPPQGFIFSAILTVIRKKDNLAFLNALLASDMPGSVKSSKRGRSHDPSQLSHVWKHHIDISKPSNIARWQCMREIVLRFGSSYKARTDTNGFIVMIYVGLFTIFLVIGTVVMNGTLPWEDYAFYFVMHLMLIIPMGFFGVSMALEGDQCNDVADQTKLALSMAMMRLEEKHEKSLLSKVQVDNLHSCRFAATQLHEALTASARLNPTQMLDIIDLDRTLVLSVVFAVVTQITLMFENVEF